MTDGSVRIVRYDNGYVYGTYNSDTNFCEVAMESHASQKQEQPVNADILVDVYDVALNNPTSYEPIDMHFEFITYNWDEEAGFAQWVARLTAEGVQIDPYSTDPYGNIVSGDDTFIIKGSFVHPALPVGDVQIFDGEDCKFYYEPLLGAACEPGSVAAFVRLNRPYGFGNYVEYHQGEDELIVNTPYPSSVDDDYWVRWLVDLVSDKHREPFQEGQVLAMYNPLSFEIEMPNHPVFVFGT